MDFQVKKIILWPKDTKFPPREVNFELNKVNVITGASRTGKSAIIPIIDYCLGSKHCSIPIDTIRDNVSWYGVIIQTSDDQILVARRVPTGNRASNDFYWYKSEKVSYPNEIEISNSSFESVKRYLNEIAFLPFFNLDEDESNNGFKSRLSIRDLMAFVFQTQDVVANQNILFYKTHAHEHREKLRNWFPYILGAEDVSVLKARQRLQTLERKLNKLKRELEKETAISEEWKSNIYGHLRTAIDYGLIDEDFNEKDVPERLIEIAKELLSEMPDKPLISTDSINKSNDEIKVLEAKGNVLAIEVGTLKKRLDEVNRLKSGFSDYGAVVKKRADRLHISRWLSDVAQDADSCPMCGGGVHLSANGELSKVSKVLESYEEDARRYLDVPTAFDREEHRLKQDMEELLEQASANQNRYDWLISQSKEAQSEFYKKKEMYIFLGHFKASLERFEKLLSGGELDGRIKKLQEEYDLLFPLVDERKIGKRVEAATSEISTTILDYLQSLDVEDKYRLRMPEFNVKELGIRVMGSEGDWHFLAEVGSASNWVSFHIATMCALHEFFAKMPHSSVPSFAIFDQPSQVYFPKVRVADDQVEEADHKDFRDEDLEAVKKIFSALSKSISKKNSSWQFIVLDHADSDIYGGIENVHEVEIWRDGNKLVPEEWYE